MEIKEKEDYYDAAMRQIKGDSWSLSAYGYLKSNEEWIGRYEDFLEEVYLHFFGDEGMSL